MGGIEVLGWRGCGGIRWLGCCVFFCVLVPRFASFPVEMIYDIPLFSLKNQSTQRGFL